MKESKIIFLRLFARTLLTIITLFWLFFASLSGADLFTDGFKGIIKNLPNTLPWIGIIIINILAWKKELLGGILLILSGLYLGYFFGVHEGNLTVLFLIVIPFVLLGGIFVMCNRGDKAIEK